MPCVVVLVCVFEIFFSLALILKQIFQIGDFAVYCFLPQTQTPYSAHPFNFLISHVYVLLPRVLMDPTLFCSQKALRATNMENDRTSVECVDCNCYLPITK